mmetsp:Transcript_9021/g.25156  ORF Transcript_9021/g.25156 Transcript_9021/m.25156 type:complete len:272 (-) Transcript_9021:21-836(-)
MRHTQGPQLVVDELVRGVILGSAAPLARRLGDLLQWVGPRRRKDSHGSILGHGLRAHVTILVGIVVIEHPGRQGRAVQRQHLHRSGLRQHGNEPLPVAGKCFLAKVRLVRLFFCHHQCPVFHAVPNDLDAALVEDVEVVAHFALLGNHIALVELHDRHGFSQRPLLRAAFAPKPGDLAQVPHALGNRPVVLWDRLGFSVRSLGSRRNFPDCVVWRRHAPPVGRLPSIRKLRDAVAAFGRLRRPRLGRGHEAAALPGPRRWQPVGLSRERLR